MPQRSPRSPPRCSSGRWPSPPAASTRRCARSTRSAAPRGSSPPPRGAWLTDVDGNDYVDLICSWGPMLLGHAHPEVAGGGPGGGGPRYVVRHADPARGRAGRGDRGPHAGRAGPVRLLRHRGDDVGDPAGPRLHRPRRGREVRRLLPRPRRRAAGLGRLRAGHLRAARHPRRTRLVDRADPGAALQRPGRGREGLRRARRPDRLPDHRGRPRQHGRGPARAGVQRLPGRDLPAATARCSSATR